MNKKPVAITAIALVVVGTGAQYACRSAREGAAAVLYGNVDIREVSLAFRVGGRVAEINVDEGSTVRQGDVIASLDPEPLQNALHSAEAAAAALGARNAMLHRGYRSEDVQQAKARLESARAALAEAERQLTRQRTLAPEGASPQRLLDAALSARDQAAAACRAAEEAAHQMQTGYRPEEVAESDGQLKQAQATLEAARLNLRDARLTAPSDGILLTRAVEKGSMVQAGAGGFSLTLTNPVWVRAYVAEPQLGHFNSGTKVTLHTDQAGGKVYHGVVGFVSPTSEFTPKTVETADLRTALVYRLRIVVQDPDTGLRQGMPVTVRLEK
jgi:HlyD family secretion protein